MAKDFIPRGKFQPECTKFMLENPRSQVNVDMGCGKTIMVLNAIDALILSGESKPTLILAPKRVATSTWSDEVKKWNHLSHLEVSTIVGDATQRKIALRRDAPIYTCNYENVPWLMEQLKGKWPFGTVVADESTKLKSHRAHYRKTKKGNLALVCNGGARTNAIAPVAFKHTERWINLTGTFAPNGLEHIWGQLWFIDQGRRLGTTYSAFLERWFKVGFNGYGLEALPHAEEEIRHKISDVTFTLRAEDYLDLPDEIVNTIFVQLPPAAFDLYKKMEKEMFIQIEAGDVEAFTAASKSGKCQQIANGAVYYDRNGNWEHIHDAKIEALQSVIEEANGMPIIVVYKFKSDLVRLEKAFPKGKKLDQNPKTKEAFEKGKIPVLFLHPGSAGHGIDGLQKATNILCFYSLDWNVEERMQTIARIGKVRQMQAGFNRPTYVHQLAAADTVDEDIIARVEERLTVEEALKRGLARRGLK